MKTVIDCLLFFFLGADNYHTELWFIGVLSHDLIFLITSAKVVRESENKEEKRAITLHRSCSRFPDA